MPHPGPRSWPAGRAGQNEKLVVAHDGPEPGERAVAPAVHDAVLVNFSTTISAQDVASSFPQKRLDGGNDPTTHKKPSDS